MNEVSFRTTGRSRVMDGDALKVVCAFGTRPEVIKFLPVLREFARHPSIRTVNVLTSQHTDLIAPLLDLWGIGADHDLQVMKAGQGLNALMSRIQSRMDSVLERENPDIVLVQGDTTTSLAASLAAWHRGIPVGHIEAGLRSGARDTPFPEEMNRRLTSSIATLHFAPTERNANALRLEGVPEGSIVRSGNPIVDAVRLILEEQSPSPWVLDLVESLKDYRIVVATTHRRESFGRVMSDRLQELRAFVERHQDVCLLFPVHSNPAVMRVAKDLLGDAERVHLVEPLSYPDFLYCLANSWLIVSDSGGIQEEAPSLGKPLLIIRGNTERPETIECGIARLIGEDPLRLRAELEEAAISNSWVSRIEPVANPFGNGDSAQKIADAILKWHGQAAGEPAGNAV